MRQCSIFDPPTNHTPTSDAAAVAIEPSAATLRGVVLRFIEQQGNYGATREEIQLGTGLGGDTVRPRVWELEKAALVKGSGITRPTKSGKQAEVLVKA